MAAVAGLRSVTWGIRGVVVGRVVKVRAHPKGDRIWLADVDLGDGYPVQIVWGGRRVVRPNSLVPVAPPGARLNGTRIRRRKYRGEVSNGMLCSLAELGWDPNVTDRGALLAASAHLRPGTCLDDRDVDWQSIISNGNSTGVNVLTATRSAFSWRWRRELRGTFQPQRIVQSDLPERPSRVAGKQHPTGT